MSVSFSRTAARSGQAGVGIVVAVKADVFANNLALLAGPPGVL